MNILVTGSKGQLGSEIRDISPAYPQYTFFFTDKEDLDVTDIEKVQKFIKKHSIDCLINCVGYTQVDQAEDEKEDAVKLNSTAARDLAAATARAGAMMIHISSDYVFEGKNFKPYKEGDNTNPKTIYGKTKLDGEVEVIFNAKRAVIIRTSWLFSRHGKNFVKTILEKAKTEDELRVVFDQVGSPTYAADLARAILDIIPNVPVKIRAEIYNYSNEGVASWFDFASAIVEIKGLDCKVMPILSKDITPKAIRPHYSVLDKSRIKKDFGIEIPHWRDSLKRCLELL